MPVGGRGEQHEFGRAFSRRWPRKKRTIVFLSVLPPAATRREVEAAREDVARLATLHHADASVEIVQAKDAIAAIDQRARDFDLVLFGLGAPGKNKRAFGDFATRASIEVNGAKLFLNRRPLAPLERWDPLRRR